MPVTIRRSGLLMHGALGLLMRQRRRARRLSEEEQDDAIAGAQRRGAARPGRFAGRWCDIDSGSRRDMPMYTVRPRTRRRSADRVMIYLHGGGHSMPIQNRHWNLICTLARQNAMRVIVPLCALVPEGRHADAQDALMRLYVDLLRAGSGATVACIAGDSSGGGLALSLAQRIRDEGLEPPEHLVLFSPWLDLSVSEPETELPAQGEPIIDAFALRRAGEAWASPALPDSPEVSPLFGDLSGLPPMEVFVGTRDLLVADSRRLLRRAEACGGRVNLVEYWNGFHVFMWLWWLPETRHVMRRVRTVLRGE